MCVFVRVVLGLVQTQHTRTHALANNTHTTRRARGVRGSEYVFGRKRSDGSYLVAYCASAYMDICERAQRSICFYCLFRLTGFVSFLCVRGRVCVPVCVPAYMRVCLLQVLLSWLVLPCWPLLWVGAVHAVHIRMFVCTEMKCILHAYMHTCINTYLKYISVRLGIHAYKRVHMQVHMSIQHAHICPYNVHTQHAHKNFVPEQMA